MAPVVPVMMDSSPAAACASSTVPATKPASVPPTAVAISSLSLSVSSGAGPLGDLLGGGGDENDDCDDDDAGALAAEGILIPGKEGIEGTEGLEATGACAFAGSAGVDEAAAGGLGAEAGTLTPPIFGRPSATGEVTAAGVGGVAVGITGLPPIADAAPMETCE